MNRPEFMNRTGLAYWRIGQLTLALMLLALSAATAGTRQSNLFSELATKNFRAGNELLEQHKPAEALLRFQVALKFVSDDTSILFNGGLAAYLSGNFPVAAELWERL